MTERFGSKASVSRRLLLLVAGLMAIAGPSVRGQEPSTATTVKLPAFDVVSIKPDKTGGGMIRVMYRPDGYSATNISLTMLILGAYGIREDLLSGTAGLGRVEHDMISMRRWRSLMSLSCKSSRMTNVGFCFYRFWRTDSSSSS